MGKILKNISIIFGPYLYFIGYILFFIGREFTFLIPLFLGLICYIFARSYCIYYVVKNREQYKDKWILHLILLLLLCPFYIPVFYIHFVLKKHIALAE